MRKGDQGSRGLTRVPGHSPKCDAGQILENLHQVGRDFSVTFPSKKSWSPFFTFPQTWCRGSYMRGSGQRKFSFTRQGRDVVTWRAEGGTEQEHCWHSFNPGESWWGRPLMKMDVPDHSPRVPSVIRACDLRLRPQKGDRRCTSDIITFLTSRQRLAV